MKHLSFPPEMLSMIALFTLSGKDYARMMLIVQYYGTEPAEILFCKYFSHLRVHILKVGTPEPEMYQDLDPKTLCNDITFN